MQTSPTNFLPGESDFFIPGKSGLIQARSYLPKERAPNKIAIICHPHPLYHGTMDNKVVHTLSRAFYKKNILSIRFNYRGVGKSEGNYGNSLGEIEDLISVIKWAKSIEPECELYLAGFSFGSYIAAKAAQIYQPLYLFSLAPAVTNQPYSDLDNIKCPWTVIQGELDEVIEANLVYAWFAKQKLKQSSKFELIKIKDGSHFFHGKLIELQNYVISHLM